MVVKSCRAVILDGALRHLEHQDIITALLFVSGAFIQNEVYTVCILKVSFCAASGAVVDKEVLVGATDKKDLEGPSTPTDEKALQWKIGHSEKSTKMGWHVTKG